VEAPTGHTDLTDHTDQDWDQWDLVSDPDLASGPDLDSDHTDLAASVMALALGHFIDPISMLR
jgi:hypothetical protein